MAIYTKIQMSELRDIVKPYNINVVNFTPMDGGNTNSNYHVQTTNAAYMLSIVEEKSLLEVNQLAGLLQWLSEQRISTSLVLPTLDGALATRYNGKPVLIKQWITGKIHKEMDDDMLSQIGASMAQLHLIDPPDFLRSSHPYGKQVFSSILDKNIDPTYEYWLKDQSDFLNSNIPDGLPKGMIHGDIFFDNVLFVNNNLKAIIDFEEACNYYLIFDLGMSILGLCRTQGQVDLTKARALINGYEQIRLLKSLEKNYLRLFVQYAAVATSCWRFWKYNISAPKPLLKNKHWEMVHVAKDMDNMTNEHFLSAVLG